MIGHWIFKNGVARNYGSSGYGSVLSQKENVYKLDDPNLADFYYSFGAENVSGKIIEQGQFSFGMMGLKSGQVPYVKNGSNFYKPDNKFAASSAEWSLYYRKEQFADQDYTLSFYKNGVQIYTQGIPQISANGDIFFCQTGLEIKLYDALPIDPVKVGPVRTFGATSGTISSGISLRIGGPSVTIGSGMRLSIGAYSSPSGSCYILDESGNIVYDELNDALLEENCSASGGFGFFGGFDMFISGQNLATFIMPLYMQQGDLTYGINSGIPLYLYNTQNILTNSINLTVLNNYASVGSGVNLYIANLDSDNDGYVPINSGIPLFIQRNENTYFNLVISGGTTAVSGITNLYLNANKYPISGSTNLSMPYTKDFSLSGAFLYTAGF